MNYAEIVFDNIDLRRLILYHYVHLKYKDELKEKVKQFAIEQILRKWYKFCKCELCTSNREYSLFNYGEVL